ncbi:MAG: hypothetical protein IJV14_10780 [Lachnospiraceae bacterium]|nr:hypothetical protein [Lachnospiraceae bacterium]
MTSFQIGDRVRLLPPSESGLTTLDKFGDRAKLLYGQEFEVVDVQVHFVKLYGIDELWFNKKALAPVESIEIDEAPFVAAVF